MVAVARYDSAGNGRRLIGFDLRFLPSAGNDELTIVTK